MFFLRESYVRKVDVVTGCVSRGISSFALVTKEKP
jgi:hypothetical protein